MPFEFRHRSRSAVEPDCFSHGRPASVALIIPLLAVMFLLLTSPAQAQFAGGFGGQGGFGAQGGFPGGISIDADGVVKADFRLSRSNRLAKQKVESFQAEHLDLDLSRSSELRKVSLSRLERACEAIVDKGETPGADVQYLAGLQRIDFVFVYPETGDLVIAGPAGSFAPDASGRMVGADSGRPVLRLDDLLVALRSVRSASMIRCSIDPTQSGLARFSDFVRRNSSPATPAQIARRFQGMAAALGPQNVSVSGVSPQSHFARVLVEADYQMKLISIGKVRVPVRNFRSHLSMIPVGGNTLQRWWFTPLYAPFQKTPDGTAYAFSGQRVQLMSQDEQVSATGRRSATAFKRVSTEAFARQFTDRYEEVAAVFPVFAELQNLIDLAVLTALIHKEQLSAKAGWGPSFFLDADRATVAEGRVPKTVDSIFNTRNAGRVIIGLVAGGVTIDPESVLASTPLEASTDRLLTGPAAASRPDPDISHWWWD